jgi:hypothetical protein
MGIEELKTMHDGYAAVGKIDIRKRHLRDLTRAPLDLAAMRRAPSLTYVGAGEVKVAASEYTPANILMLGFPNINHPGQFLSGELLAAIALANSLKTVMNAHAADATEHPGGADNVNFPVATADASTLTTLLALTEDLIIAYDGHDGDAEAGSPTYHQATEASDHSINPTTAPTTLLGTIDRLNELKSRYNGHDADATAHDTGGTHQEATADAPLTDGYHRVNFADTSMNFATSTTFFGSEKASQYYEVFGVAAAGDTDYTLKAMPLMRYSSQASQVITLRNNLDAANIGYGFTTNSLVGGLIYILSGTSKGLMRTITANNNNNTTAGTITYGGSALTMTQGDWFIVLPPGTNFRWIGPFYNNVSSNIAQFNQTGNRFEVGQPTLNGTAAPGVVENVAAVHPLAEWMHVHTEAVSGAAPYGIMKHPDIPLGAYYISDGVVTRQDVLAPVRNCRTYFDQCGAAQHTMMVNYYELPDGYFG